jgi:hypothetical protein
MVGSCECGKESSGSIKCGEFLDWMRDYQVLKKNTSIMFLDIIHRLVFI